MDKITLYVLEETVQGAVENFKEGGPEAHRLVCRSLHNPFILALGYDHSCLLY